MLTTLFPKDDAPISIKQGRPDDCFLLASLDCILNSGPHGLALLKSLCEEVKDGVIIRLPHTHLSANLSPKLLKGKYEYTYDSIGKRDEFFLNWTQLERIDKSQGVSTNALIVKILEHLIPYYFIKGNRRLRRSSLSAHSDTHHRTGNDDTVFVAKLLGIKAEIIKDYKEATQIKESCPSWPIFIGIYDYKPAGCDHALRLDNIISGKTGSKRFVLVNPWDNLKKEMYPLDEKARYYFSLFIINDAEKEKLALIRLLSKNPTLAKPIFANIELLQMILEMKKVLGASFSKDDVEYGYSLFQQNPHVPSIFNRVSLSEQRAIIFDMTAAKGDFQGPIHSKLVRYFSYGAYLVEYLHKNWMATYFTQMAIQQINNISVSFLGMLTYMDIVEKYNAIVAQIYMQVHCSPSLIYAESLLGVRGVARSHPAVIYALDKKVEEIRDVAQKTQAQIEASLASKYVFFNTKPSSASVALLPEASRISC